MTKELYLLGVSSRTAPAAVREQLNFNPADAASIIRRAAGERDDLEAVVLSTCNRTEFYLAAPPGRGAARRWFDLLREARPGARALEAEGFRYRACGAEAARHLFRVAAGLDSAVLGDVQILGQVKDALALSNAAGGVGNYLNRTFDFALRAGKRARTETSIGRGAASLGSALAGMLARRTNDPASKPRVLIIGAGEIARDISRHLTKRLAVELTITNRTAAKAASLAGECGARVLSWELLEGGLCEADVAVAATSACEPLLRRETLDEAVARRPHRPLLVVDAGMPRNVEAGSAAEVIDIDAVREQQEEVLAARRAATPAAERIVSEELRRWEEWRAGLLVEQAVKAIYAEAEMLSRDVAPIFAADRGINTAEAERVLLRDFKRALHPHVRLVRELPPEQKLSHLASGIDMLRALGA